MTEIATHSQAARRARARALRAVSWQRCEGQAGAVDPGNAGEMVGAVDAACAGTGERVELVAQLPSTEAATVLLLCELAAELTG